MLMTAMVFFGLAIVIGLMMLMYVLASRSVPRILSFTHGPLAVIGLVLLIIYSYLNTSPMMAVIALFVLVALGGLTLFYKDITGKPLPKWLALVHGFIAIGTFFYLVTIAVSAAQ